MHSQKEQLEMEYGEIIYTGVLLECQYVPTDETHPWRGNPTFVMFEDGEEGISVQGMFKAFNGKKVEVIIRDITEQQMDAGGKKEKK